MLGISPACPVPNRATLAPMPSRALIALASLTLASSALAQTTPPSSQTPTQIQAPASAELDPRTPTHADILRGAYGPDRANNDLLYYHLDIRVDPEKKFISGKNTIRFKMLADAARIQIDLVDTLAIDKILLGATPLRYTRDSGAVLIDFPQTLKAGTTQTIDFFFSGHPIETGRFGVFTFKQDASGHPWINTACEGIGASLWWPNKDQWRDEVQNMDISVAIPSNLVEVSNGRFLSKRDLGDGYTQWNWHVHYPINNYDVSLNIGNYQHFADKLGPLTLDFYALPEDLDKAKRQFSQAKLMLQAYQHYFGEYPFIKDGYKLIQVPYAGMEHQSAVTYGNHFANGYFVSPDWTGVGISPRFDFIIIHESGHEWFGNAVSAADPSDMWIHEGWTTYLESLYVEYRWGKPDALKYINGYKSKVRNLHPILGPHGVNFEPPIDQYFKGILFLNTLRSIVDNDPHWFKLIHNLFQHFKYKNILTEDVVAYFNQQTAPHLHQDLTPIFDQYLRHPSIPILDLAFDPAAHTVRYRWRTDEPAFAMPIRVGDPAHWLTIRPTTQWQTLPTLLTRDTFQVATDLFYVNVDKS